MKPSPCVMCGEPTNLYIGMCDRCFVLFKARTAQAAKSAQATLEKAKRLEITESRLHADKNPL